MVDETVVETTADPPVDTEPGDRSGDALAELEAARARWADAGLGDHTLVVQDDCGECGPEARAIGQVVSWGGRTYASGPALTVDAVFDRIEAALADGREVVATYDEETGYPSDVLIDPAAAEVDGGTHLIIHEVQDGLPGDEVSLDSFEEAALRWESAGPHSYEYVVTVACEGCPFEGRLYTRVAGDRVVDERFEPAGRDGETASGTTIDELFGDLGRLFASDGGLVEDGVLINGTAEYDSEFGYPRWIGLDLEIVEPQEWSRNLPPRLVYMIGRFTPLTMDEYCAAVDQLFSLEPGSRPDSRYLLELQRLQGLAPDEHRTMWDLFVRLADEPFDYANFNVAVDELDATAVSLSDTCPALGDFVIDDDGYLTYLR